MDERYKVAISRLGNRVRVAGSAEIGGDPRQQARRRDADALQGAARLVSRRGPASNTGASVQEWKGARPMLPDGPPVLGASGMPGVWLNLGHGSSGWALSCGSARVVADPDRRAACHRHRRPGRRAPAALSHAPHPPARRDWPLFGVAATRRIEQQAAAGVPPHTLMQRAGLAVARLALAMAPHARRVWIACGPGNNGGDGLEAAMHLHRCGHRRRRHAGWATPTRLPARLPADALASLPRGRRAHRFCQRRHPLATSPSTPCWASAPAARPDSVPWPTRIGALNALADAPCWRVDLPSGSERRHRRRAARC